MPTNRYYDVGFRCAADDPPTEPATWQPAGPGSASGGGISDNDGHSRGAAVAAGPNGDLFVAWSDTSAGDAEIYLRHWDGANWSALGGSAMDGGISDNDGDSLWPVVAVGPDGQPWVAWHDLSGGRAEIYARRWNGAAWEPAGAGAAAGGGISDNSGDSEFVDLRVDANGYAWAVWVDNSGGNAEVYVRQWNGSAWVATGGTASGGGISNSAGRSGRPALSLDPSGHPVVAWTEGSGSQSNIYARRYDGAAWVEVGAGSAAGGGISNTSGKSQYPALGFSAVGEAYLAWYDDSGGQWEILAARWDGSAWAAAPAPGGLSATAGASKEPDLAVVAGAPYVVWQETPGGNNEIYVRRRSGADWMAVGPGSASGGGLSDNAGDSSFPVVAAGNGRVYVAWEDNTGGDYEIYVLTYGP